MGTSQFAHLQLTLYCVHTEQDKGLAQSGCWGRELSRDPVALVLMGECPISPAQVRVDYPSLTHSVPSARPVARLSAEQYDPD